MVNCGFFATCVQPSLRSMRRHAIGLAAIAFGMTGLFASGQDVSVTPSAIEFGAQVVGTQSGLRKITVTNPGSSSYRIEKLFVGDDFLIQSDCGSTIPARGKCAIDVAFKPRFAGLRTCELQIVDNAAKHDTIKVEVQGEGLKPLSVKPEYLDFGRIVVGELSDSQVITVANGNDVSIKIEGIRVTDNFTVYKTCSHELAPGASCQITVAFKPESGGLINGEVNIKDDGSGLVQQHSKLQGTGVPVRLESLLVKPSVVTLDSGGQEHFEAIGTMNNGQKTNLTDSVSWSIQQGAAGGAISSSGAYTALGAAGAYVVVAKSSDPNLQATASVTVKSTNQPLANPGGPYYGVAGIATLFDGSRSTAPAGQTLTAYAWNFGDGATGAGVGPSHTYPAAGTYPVSLTVTDTNGATNRGSTTAGIVSGASPLSVSATVSPAANAAGWNNSPVTITYTCSDAISPVVSCPAPRVVSTAGANQVISATGKDKAGNTASAPVTLNIELAPPTIVASISPPLNAAGWTHASTKVSFTCSPSTAPIATCTSPVELTTEVSGQKVTGFATDVAGNSANVSVTVSVDLTPPILNVVSPSNGATIALSTASVGLSGTASDNVSGLASVTCNGVAAVISLSTFTCTAALVPGSNAIVVLATDVAGNTTALTRTLTYSPAPQITIASPVNLSVTNLSPVTVNGTISDPAAALTINGISVPQSSGSFSTPVPLVEGLNVLSAVATNSAGISGTATVQVTLDTTPPHLTIDSPADGSTTLATSVTVQGLANDVVVGTVNSQDLHVTVNGVTAQVANRSYSAANVPLALGPNTIQATGVDRAGNSTAVSVMVTRALASQPPAAAIGSAVQTEWLNIVSGNNQSGVVGAQLSSPLVVSLTDHNNQPVANQTVVFKVVGDDGSVTSNGSAPSSAVPVTTDGSGQAQVLWTLGQRAGAGNNMLQVSSPLAVSPVSLGATGLTGTPTQIVVDSGNNQTGVLGQQLAFPFVADVVDAGHNRVAGIPVTFTVKSGGGTLAGAASQIVTSDSNGRVIAVLTLGLQQGFSNNVVEATFTGNTGFPAAFAATAQAPGNPANTSISGVVLDNSNNPITGATVRLYQIDQGNANNLPIQIGASVETNAVGGFTIAPAPVGSYKLMVDGTTVTGTKSYPTLEYDIVTIAGINNTVGMPIYLPALDTTDKVCVDETHGGTLTLPQYPGFSLTIAPGSATFPGGSRTGCVSATPVNGDKIPMAPGFGQQPRFIVTIQPVGTTFNPPAPITLPNVDGLAPREVTEMYSYDHDLSMFVAIGTGTVSNDGSEIVSNPGVGVLKAGWHCGGDPNTTGSAGTCPQCQTCNGDGCAADPGQNGNPAPDNKCMTCQNGSLSPIPIDPTEVTAAYTFQMPSETIDDINGDLKELTEIGILASLTPASITGSITTQQCCSPNTGPDNKSKGVITGSLGSFSFKGKIWPPGPIPKITIEIDAFGLAQLDAEVLLVAGVFAGLDGSVQGEIGYTRDGCSMEEADRSGCVFGDFTVPLTLSLSAQIGGSGEATYSCIFCNTTKIAIDATFNFGNLSFPLNIAELTYNIKNNEPTCGAGFNGGALEWQPAKFKIGGEFVGSWQTNGGVVEKEKFSADLVSCTIDLTNGIKCPPYF